MFLYRITCQVNGKQYIGMAHNPKYRFTDHKRAKTLIGNAMRKHRKENFDIEVLVEGEDQYIADLETPAILKFKTLHPFGYNLSLQTQTSFKHHEMSKEKMRKPKSAEARANMSKAKIGKPNGRKGIWSPSEEARNKIRTIHKVITPDGTFDSIQQAAKFYGLGDSAIYQRCNGKLKSFQNWKAIKE